MEGVESYLKVTGVPTAQHPALPASMPYAGEVVAPAGLSGTVEENAAGVEPEPEVVERVSGGGVEAGSGPESPQAVAVLALHRKLLAAWSWQQGRLPRQRSESNVARTRAEEPQENVLSAKARGVQARLPARARQRKLPSLQSGWYSEGLQLRLQLKLRLGLGLRFGLARARGGGAVGAVSAG